MKPARSRGRVVAALAAALLAGAAAFWATAPRTPTTEALASGAALPTSVGQTPSPTVTGPRQSPTPLIPAPTGRATTRVEIPVPTQLEIPSVRLRMPLTPVGLDSRGDMELPPSPKVAGWYRYGPAPGSNVGAAVIAGHVDTPEEGVGPLDVLEQLKPGTVIVVRSGTQTTRYAVKSVRKVGKGELDLDALFARDGPHRLHVVTCGGEFDRRTRQYTDNVVAVAVPLA